MYRTEAARPAPVASGATAAAARSGAPTALPARITATPASSSATPAGAWIAGAVTLMTLPLVITAGLMMAPLAWMWATRKSTNG